MASLIRDSAFGHLLRFVLGSHVLPHSDEIDPSTAWRNAVHRESSLKGKRTPSAGSEHFDAQRRELQITRDEGRYVSSAISEVISPSASDSLRIDGHKNRASIERAEPGTDHFLVGWYSDGDLDNPQNWSQGKKLWILFQTCFFTWSIFIGSSIYTAGLTDVEEKFGVSDVAATLGLTCFVAGYGIGPMLWAPLSEIPQVGRMPIYIGTLIVFVLFQVPTALARNFGMLLAFRFLTGFFGSPVLANGGATIADIYNAQHRTYAITMWGLVASLGPIVGPLVGGFAAAAKGWTWTIWEIMWLSGFALVFLFFFFPETSPSNILYRRAHRLRKATRNQNLRSQSELDAADQNFSEVITDALVRPITLNFLEPIVLALNLYIALVYALLYLWFESFPIVFIGIYGFSESTVGLSYLGILVGALVVTPVFFVYLKYVQEPMHSENGSLKPEARLPVAIICAFVLPICLFWFGWTSRSDVPWIVPVIGSSLFGFSVLPIFNVVLNYLADAYPQYAASVLAGNDLMRAAFGAAFPLFARAMYHRLGVGWASSLLGFLACAFIPIPIILFRYGERIRLASRRARRDY
ncbi:putative caffeine resistance protein 5 [Vararia minispora EC-137]|uniref:Caffeine resistance protein 5 n=1 Tax=Vararia minispora EC-137 TaxID=1314806 RepID=A0ACB8QK77_9AGAM|nr:putative caffeine resistance protein 5 [Vararia minispora EC-137]